MTAVPPTTDSPEPEAPNGAARRPYRPPIGVPIEKQRRTAGAIVSVLLHVLVVMLLLFPFFGSDLVAEFTGAGGPGPAGGGGGGTGGTGGGRVVNERVQYVVPPPPPPVERSETEFIQPPVEKPPEVPPPEVTPSPVVPPPEVTPVPTASVASADINLPAADAAARTAGSGGGSGNDGSTGSGSGSGGGIGSGIGTGTGSSVGPGTGGGTGRIFPPTPAELFIPPIPVPKNVKGKTITIVFDVDSTGKALDFEFTPTRDAGYNRKLSAILAETRFRPATDGTGRPVRAKYSLEYTF